MSHIFALTVLMGLTLVSCGKKAQEHSAAVDPLNPGVETQIGEETHLEILAAIKANDLDKLKRLLALKTQIDLNIILEDGETLLTTAVALDRFQMVEILIENNASVFRSNKRKETPLMVAAKYGLEDLVRLLMTLGSKTDNKDQDGNTALHLAILSKFETVALYLINSSINIDITNNNNQTALKLAELNDLKKVVELLRSLTQTSVGLPDKMTVRNMVALGNVVNLNQLFSKYPTIVNEYKDLNFYVLIMRSHPHDKALGMTHLLMSYGADLNGPSGAEISPLIEAVKRGYEDFMILMLNENVNPDILDDSGKSALVWAIEKKSDSMVKSLVEKNAAKKYTYYVDGNKKKMNSCDVARSVRKQITSSEDKKIIENIMDYLGCGLRWLF